MVKNKTVPLVTIGVTSYNHAKYIIETLDSVANQTYKDFQLIISDDRSPDNSVEVIKNWIENHPEMNILFIQNEVNVGLCNSLNNMLKKATGEYISFIASDDTYDPGFIEHRVNFLKDSGPEIGMCYSKSYLMDMDSKFIGTEERPKWISGDVYDELCYMHNSFCKPFTSMVKKEVYEKIGNYNPELAFEDLDFLFRVARNYQIIYIDHIDTKYRLVTNSLSDTISLTPTGVNSTIQIINDNFGHSKNGDIGLARRLKKLAKKKRLMKMESWKQDYKKSLKYESTFKERLISFFSFLLK